MSVSGHTLRVRAAVLARSATADDENVAAHTYPGGVVHSLRQSPRALALPRRRAHTPITVVDNFVASSPPRTVSWVPSLTSTSFATGVASFQVATETLGAAFADGLPDNVVVGVAVPELPLLVPPPPHEEAAIATTAAAITHHDERGDITRG